MSSLSAYNREKLVNANKPPDPICYDRKSQSSGIDKIQIFTHQNAVLNVLRNERNEKNSQGKVGLFADEILCMSKRLQIVKEISLKANYAEICIAEALLEDFARAPDEWKNLKFMQSAKNIAEKFINGFMLLVNDVQAARELIRCWSTEIDIGNIFDELVVPIKVTSVQKKEVNVVAAPIIKDVVPQMVVTSIAKTSVQEVPMKEVVVAQMIEFLVQKIASGGIMSAKMFGPEKAKYFDEYAPIMLTEKFKMLSCIQVVLDPKLLVPPKSFEKKVMSDPPSLMMPVSVTVKIWIRIHGDVRIAVPP